MGEFVLYRGRPVKLGTCENLYYIRHDDLVRMVAAGEVEKKSGNAAPVAYLADPYRFRFPFPNEDDIPPFTYQDFDAAFAVDVTGAGLLFPEEHYTVSASFHPRGGGYNVNVFLPCPQSPDFAPTVESSGIDWQIVEIVQQRPVDGSLLTVVRCPYCGVAWRLDAEDAVKLSAYLVARAHDYGCKMARRVLAGYGLTLEEVEA